MLDMGPRDLNSAPYSPVHCSSHSMTSFQSSELTELPVVENSQLFAQRRTAHGTPPITRRVPRYIQSLHRTRTAARAPSHRRWLAVIKEECLPGALPWY